MSHLKQPEAVVFDIYTLKYIDMTLQPKNNNNKIEHEDERQKNDDSQVFICEQYNK